MEDIDQESVALTIRPTTTSNQISIAEAKDLSVAMAESKLISDSLQKRPADILTILLMGREHNLQPMVALSNISIISGKPSMNASLMVAIVLGSGKAKYFRRISADANAATYETMRVGDEAPQRVTWTIKQARDAGYLVKDNWRTNPRAMLAARAKSELVRDVYPDVLSGCYTPDEITNSDDYGYKNADSELSSAAVEVVSSATAKIQAAQTLDELAKAVEQLNSLPLDAREQVRAAYVEQRNILRGELKAKESANA